MIHAVDQRQVRIRFCGMEQFRIADAHLNVVTALNDQRRDL